MTFGTSEGPTHPGVVVVGVPVVDMVAYVQEFPAPGGHSPGTSLAVMPGGPAANVASGAARLGRPVSLLGRVGDDHLGILLRRGLEADGVVVPAELITPGAATATVLVLFDEGGAGQMRSFSFRQGTADTRLAAADVGPEHLERAGALFLDGILALEEPLTLAGERAAELARGRGARVFLDPNLRIPGETLPHDLGERMQRLARVSDELLLNEFEARLLLRHVGGGAVGGVNELGAGIMSGFPNLTRLVIKRGAAGASVFEAGAVLAVEAVRVEVSDTSGAGDSFDAAWLCAHLEGRDTAEAARFAAAAAALTVTGKGAWASLPTRARLDAFLRAASPEA